MIDVAVAIDKEAVPVALRTRAAGQYDDDGEWVPGAATDAAIMAVVQPASGRQLMDLPEGIRTEARWLVWSRAAIEVDNEITFGGKSYRVLFTWPRAEAGFTRAAAGLLK